MLLDFEFSVRMSEIFESPEGRSLVWETNVRSIICRFLSISGEVVAKSFKFHSELISWKEIARLRMKEPRNIVRSDNY